MGKARPATVEFDVKYHDTRDNQAWTYTVHQPIENQRELLRALRAVPGVLYSVRVVDPRTVRLELSDDTKSTHVGIVRVLAYHLGVPRAESKKIRLNIFNWIMYKRSILFEEYLRLPA